MLLNLTQLTLTISLVHHQRSPLSLKQLNKTPQAKVQQGIQAEITLCGNVTDLL